MSRVWKPLRPSNVTREDWEKFSLADFTLGRERQSPHFDLYCERFHIGREEL
jgi:hypothetical protein